MILRKLSSALVVRQRPRALSTGMVVRVAFAALAVCLALGPALAAENLALRGDVGIKADALTLRDLVQGASGPLADKPLFRSPVLGQTGTIQARRIVEAALALGLGPVETGGRAQVTVTRAARRIGPSEIEAAIRKALEGQQGLDAASASIVLDGAPTLVVPVDVAGPVAAEEVSYDRRGRRVSALVTLGSAPGERRASLRVAGGVVETVEVPVLTRAVARGETVQAGDLALERRAKDSAPNDVEPNGRHIAGRVARRPMPAGTVIRAADLGRPEVIARGDAVLLVYEAPGLSLSIRARANEAGAQGDTITVSNPQSKRTVQATVLGPGRAAAIGFAPPSVPATLADASGGRP